MPRNISDAVREVCLSFPESVEVETHSLPNFRVRGKIFATYTINHHGDGRVALWLEAQSGAQNFYTEMEPEYYFVPPYVGPKGWLGVELNKGLRWESIAARVREAYAKVAPSELIASIGDTLRIKAPVKDLSPEQINPFLQPKAQKVIKKLAEICAALPETSAATQFGNPVWKAGKKTFVCSHYYHLRLNLQVWVGTEQQSFLTMDERYRIPYYVGNRGWIDLDVADQANWKEIEHLVLTSYRHFALQRMLKLLA